MLIGDPLFICLDRGREDIDLRKELNNVFSIIGQDGIKQLAIRYPRLLELKQGLDREKET